MVCGENRSKNLDACLTGRSLVVVSPVTRGPKQRLWCVSANAINTAPFWRRWFALGRRSGNANWRQFESRSLEHADGH